jgi:hypothetical protein
VDWAVSGPTIVVIAKAIEAVDGVHAANITVTEIDMETIGSDVTVEGEGIDPDTLVRAIEETGAVVHSIDHLVVGDRLVEAVPRAR